MNRELLKKYLSGAATDTQRQQVETLLSESGTVIDEAVLANSDSLIEAIQRSAPESCDSVDENKSEDEQRRTELVERIQSLIPRQAIGKDELERLLDPPEQDDELGRISRFRVLEFVACGGMGLVFKADDPQLNRDVCIKIMNPALAAQAEAKERFEREARAAARLQSERIVTVLEVGEHRQLPYLVMPLLEGESLSRRLQREEKLDPDTALRVAIQAAQGLRYAHARGYLHRDIKPDNIWLTAEGDVILLDLGLARAKDESVDLTHSGTVLGTPCYMSPEQVQGQLLQESSDLFSLGIVLFEMLTGVSPFDRTNVFSTMMSVANDTLPIPLDTAENAIPNSLLPIIRKLLEKDPAARPESAEEVIDLLERATSGGLSGAKVAGAGGRWSRFKYTMAGAAAAALIGWAAWLIYVKTDKGTLVVRADPSVEVKLADRSLSVRDPKSGKEYTVRIGEQPLPSGVYRLEMEDPSRELVFTSSVIAIRRGQTELVSIELRSDVDIADGDHEEPAAIPARGAVNDDALESAEPEFRLADLPALDAAATRRVIGLQPGQPISPSALVQSPQKLSGVDAWSVQPSRPFFGRPSVYVRNSDGLRMADSARPQLSPDGRRIVSAGSSSTQRNSQSTVYVWDESFEITHMLPTTGGFGAVYWSPDPNILAVLCKGDRREAMVWRLCEDHAEILQVIPVSATRMAWSPSGDQIVFQTEQGIQFHRLTDRQTYSIPNASFHGGFGSHAWSLDGRLFTTQKSGAVNVWSLETGQMVHIFPKAASPRWLQPGGELLIQQSDDAQTWCEVWNMDTMVRKDFFALPLDWRATTFVVDDRFERFAVITKNQRLAVGLIHGPKRQLDLVLPEPRRTLPDREWRTRKKEGDPPAPGLQLSRDGQAVLLSLYQDAALVRVDSQNGPSIVTSWTNLVQPRPPSFYQEDYRTSQVLLDRTQYDMNTGISLSAQPFDLQELRPVSPELTMTWSPGDDETGGVRPSPRGTYLAVAKGNVTMKDGADGELKDQPTFHASSSIRVITAATGEVLHEFETDAYIQHVEWSEDERFLVLTSSNGSNSSTTWAGRLQVINLRKQELLELPVRPRVWASSDRHGFGFKEPRPRSEITEEPVYPFSKIAGDRLLVPDPEWVLIRGPSRLRPVQEAGAGGGYVLSPSSAIYRYYLKTVDLNAATQIDAKLMGYFCHGLREWNSAGNWMSWRGLDVSSSYCEKALSGESVLSGEREFLSDLRKADSSNAQFVGNGQLHVMAISTGKRSRLDSSYSLKVDRTGRQGTPSTCLSPGGEYLCLYGPSGVPNAYELHVLSTEKLGATESAEDADLVVERTQRTLREWDSPDRPIWHHARPVLAWRAKSGSKRTSERSGQAYTRWENDGIRWYDARSKETLAFKAFDGEILSIRSMQFGWVVQDECSVLAFDYQGGYLGRWLDGSPPSSSSDKPQLNCWIDAAGSVKSVLSPSGFNTVLLRGNQFTATSLESFQSKFADQLPEVIDPFASGVAGDSASGGM